MAKFGNLFLSVGAMKAGTTWLYAMLRRHPELHFTPQKEIHYFFHKYVNPEQLNEDYRLREVHARYRERSHENKNINLFRHYARWADSYLGNPVDDDWYRNQFHFTGRQHYACDFSNLHAHLPVSAWPEIEASCDKLRVLFTMRDPVKRLWSHTKFELQMNNQLDNLSVWKPADFQTFLRQPHIWNNAEYGHILRNLKQGVSPQNLKVMFYENIHADKTAAPREIEDFLGIGHFNYPDWLKERRFTESAKIEMPDFFPGLVADDVARIRAEIEAEGYRIPNSWG